MPLNDTLSKWKARVVSVVGDVATILTHIGFMTIAWVVSIAAVAAVFAVMFKIAKFVFLKIV
jgi:hypothetical protein